MTHATFVAARALEFLQARALELADEAATVRARVVRGEVVADINAIDRAHLAVDNAVNTTREALTRLAWQ